MQYFGESKACCMCNCETEDWRHVLTCGSIDESLHRAVSWGKLVKSMERWHLPQELLDDDREGRKPLHRTTTQTKNTIEGE
jgi:hypothetical protein